MDIIVVVPISLLIATTLFGLSYTRSLFTEVVPGE